MRALVLTTSYPLDSSSVSGRFVEELLEGLVPRGWTFRVITPASAQGARRVQATGVSVEAVAYPGAGAGLAHAGGMPDRFAREPWLATLAPGMARALGSAAARALREEPFDLVWSHWLLPSGWIGAGVAQCAAAPHLATAHGGDVHLVERLARLPGGRTVLQRRFAATTLSAPAARTAERVQAALGTERVEFAPLPAAADPGVARHRDPAAPLRVLFLGRFEPIKGAGLLLQAAAAPGAPALEIVMAGAGSEEAALRAAAAALPSRVRFPGVLTGRDRIAALHAADVLVVPSRTARGGRGEGLPHAASLALAAGVPVIASGGGALADLIAAHGAGLVFDAGGTRGGAAARLAAALSALAGDLERHERLARCAAEAGAVFRPESALPVWDRLLRAAARRAAPAASPAALATRAAR